MQRQTMALALMMVGLWAAVAMAGEQRVTLAVDNMFCAACPFIVKRTLARVDGVLDVNVSFETKTAVVVFDDSVTNPAALSAATASVGYPSKPLP